MWINSLNLTDHSINDLTSELSDGILFAKLVNSIQEGAVNEKLISTKTKMKIIRGQNCNLVVEGIKKIPGIKVVGIGGGDIQSKNKKLVFSLLF